ncbi:MAG: hypothetical protein IKL55_02195 [Clostridia bacterium]|nr:hypothetical protein [Clostridia bacterium]
MKRITRYLLPVIILVAIIIALAILGVAGGLLATIGNAVTGFFFKHWDYTLIILITSTVTSLICAWLDEKGIRGSIFKRSRKNKSHNSADVIDA